MRSGDGFILIVLLLVMFMVGLIIGNVTGQKDGFKAGLRKECISHHGRYVQFHDDIANDENDVWRCVPERTLGITNNATTER